MRDDIVKKMSFGRGGRIGRRELFKLLAGFAGGIAAAGSLFGSNVFAVSLNSAAAAQADNVATENVSYPSGVFTIQAYLAKPKGEGKFPGIVLVHDNRGLNDNFKSIARRFAGEGFVVLAPNLASRVADTAGMTSSEAASAAISQIQPSASLDDVKAGYAFLAQNPGVDPAKISSVGFGWGGWRSFMLATAVPTLYRSVVFCGVTPIEGLENIHAPVLAHYAQYDFRTAGNAIYTEKEMKQLGKKFSYHYYPDVFGAFFYSDAGQRYNAAAADLAWTRTLEFLKSAG
jgi:carboxymethylenebutenolidase